MSELGEAGREPDDPLLGTPSRLALQRLLPGLLRECAGEDRDIALLDLGCGSGRYAKLASDTGLRGSYLGVDIEASAEWAKRQADAPPTLVTSFIVHDAHRIGELGEGRFDVIIAITTFEHFERDAVVAEGVARVLKPGGRFLIVVPTPESRLLWWRHGFRRYDAGRLRDLLHAAGLSPIREFSVGGAPSFAAHAVWTAAGAVGTYVGKGLLYAALGGRARAKRTAPDLDAMLIDLGWVHLRTRLGRRLHEQANELLVEIDPAFPVLPALVGAIAERPARTRASSSGATPSPHEEPLHRGGAKLG